MHPTGPKLERSGVIYGIIMDKKYSQCVSEKQNAAIFPTITYKEYRNAQKNG